MEAALIPLASVVGRMLGQIVAAQVTERQRANRRNTNLIQEVGTQIRGIESMIRMMQAHIDDVSGQQWRNENIVHAWIDNVQNAMVEIQDNVSEYNYLLAAQSVSSVSWSLLNRELNETRAKLREALDMRETFGMPVEVDQVSNHNLHDQLPRSMKHNEFVGFQSLKDHLIQWLASEEKKCGMFYVWGMGGVGKSSLVNYVYRSEVMTASFQYRAWVSVSQSYTNDSVLRRISEEFNIDDIEMLKLCLQQEKYFIVLDDVWNQDLTVYVQCLIERNDKGSRVIVTTRNEQVITAPSSRLRVDCLTEDDARKLFFSTAFQRLEDINNFHGLEECAENILNKCGRLPLAIVAAGERLSHLIPMQQAWQRFHDDLNWGNSNITEIREVSAALRLSIKALPSDLSNCLLHCSIFPGDYKIERKRIIRLWVAEGFITENVPGRTLEEIAERNLDFLVSRCLLEEIRNEYGKVMRYEVHRVIKDLIMEKSRKENFSMVFHGGSERIMNNKARRLSIINVEGEPPINDMIKFCSFHAFSSNSTSFLPSFKLLKVLDLYYASLASLPDAIILMLVMLRYLSIRGTNVGNLPDGLGQLIDLQTLDAWNTNVVQLPNGITRLQNLRHLMVKKQLSNNNRITAFSTPMQCPNGMCTLTNLQTLKAVLATNNLVRHLGHLTKMRSLDIRYVKEGDCPIISSSIENMSSLRNLQIRAKSENLPLPDTPRNLRYLHKLGLYGKLTKGAQWIGLLNSLKHLILTGTGIQDASFRSILGLPNLLSLYLMRENGMHHLTFDPESLPELKVLMLHNMENLQVIEVGRYALTKLQELNLVSCRRLEMIPMGLQNLRNLKKVILGGMSPAQREMFGQVEGSNIILEIL